MDFFQSSFSGFFAARPLSTAATSMGEDEAGAGGFDETVWFGGVADEADDPPKAAPAAAPEAVPMVEAWVASGAASPKAGVEGGGGAVTGLSAEEATWS